MIRTIFCTEDMVKIIKQRVRNYFIKRCFRKYFRIIFLEKKIRFKMYYLKRQGQGSGATGPVHWEKWVTTLGRCGRRDEMKNKIINI
jgi:hypothetical protein